ncbi:hypothetical protein X777_09106 [Ooceraea biroi]|uniref:Uncharacterized protein n=1 Tax=Ooceraea biroi TaxID=2015173 RepID=A0A026W7Z8_OOCBI|nr:hypothetical protein X777_09106 [Ooceraea biroi]
MEQQISSKISKPQKRYLEFVTEHYTCYETIKSRDTLLSITSEEGRRVNSEV